MFRSPFLSGAAPAFFLTIFCVSSTIAFFVPVCSLFLTRDVGATPLATGFFFAFSGLLSIGVSQLVARYSDVAGSRRNIIIFGCICGGVACVFFSFLRSYWILLFLICPLYCFAHVSGQVFAAGREYSRSRGLDPVLFTSCMRACFALAWIMVPPAAMLLLDSQGAGSVYLLCALVFAVSALAALFLPPGRRSAEARREASGARLFPERSVLYLFGCVALVFTCNGMHMIAMPQLVTGEMGLEAKFAGIFMATAAGLEIPVMLFSGRLAQKIHMRNILLVATAAGFMYYIAVSMCHTPWVFWCAQLANALFIGVITNLGMVYFQEMLPRIPGQATTLFSSAVAVGNIVSGAVCGAVSAAFGYGGVFYAAVLCSFLASVLMFLVRKI